MMKTLAMMLLFVFFENSPAQFENSDIGARAIGLNGAFTSLSNNSLAIFYNPSGLGQLKYREISLFYSPSLYGIGEISTGALTYTESLKFGTFGLGMRTFGFNLYRETNAILSYGNVYNERIFYGFNLNLYNLKIENYNSASAFGFDIGAIAYLTGFLKWGFFAKNVSGTKIGQSELQLAQVYKTGFTFQPKNDLNLVIDFEKDVKFPLSVKGGFEYFAGEYIEIRAAVGSEPVSFSGGIGINYDKLALDYAILNYQNLGITNQASLTINFGGSKAKKLERTRLENAFK